MRYLDTCRGKATIGLQKRCVCDENDKPKGELITSSIDDARSEVIPTAEEGGKELRHMG